MIDNWFEPICYTPSPETECLPDLVQCGPSVALEGCLTFTGLLACWLLLPLGLPLSLRGATSTGHAVQLPLSRPQPIQCDDFCFPSYIQLEGLAVRLNHPEGAFIGLLERSPVANTSDENKLGLAEVWWEGWLSGPVLWKGDWRKCTCLLTPAEEL